MRKEISAGIIINVMRVVLQPQISAGIINHDKYDESCQGLWGKVFQPLYHNILLQNEEVCGNTIYSSSEASGVNHIIHRSRRLR